jgi:hypothetical protein
MPGSPEFGAMSRSRSRPLIYGPEYLRVTASPRSALILARCPTGPRSRSVDAERADAGARRAGKRWPGRWRLAWRGSR